VFKHYLTTALRNFHHAPYVTTVNVIGLSLGLICFLSALGAVNYLRSSDSQFENSERIYAVTREASDEAEIGARLFIQPPVAKHIRADFPQLEAVARLHPQGEMVVSVGSIKIFAKTSLADPDLLRIFKLPFIHGDSREAVRTPLGIVITADVAKKLFGARDVLGRSLLLSNSLTVTVTGVVGDIPRPSQLADTVLKQSFDVIISFDTAAAMYRSQGIDPWMESPDSNLWRSYAPATYVLLPADGRFNLSDFKHGLGKFAERHVAKEQRDENNFKFSAIPITDVSLAALDSGFMSGSGLSIGWLLPLLGGLVLGVSCLNYANLATAQATLRAKEIGMRRVLGASRLQVATQYVFEAFLLTSIAFVIALGVVTLMSPFIESRLGVSLSVLFSNRLALIGYLCVLLPAVTLAAACYPAFVLTRERPITSLRGAGKSSPHFVPRLLVGLQFVVAGTLLIAALVVLAQNDNMRDTGLSSASEQTIAITADLPSANIDFATLRTELLKHSEIKSVAGVWALPWTGYVRSFPVARVGDKTETLETLTHLVTGDYLATLNMQLLAGRFFDKKYSSDAWPENAEPGGSYNVVAARSLVSKMGWSSPIAAIDQALTVNGKSARIIGVVDDQPLRMTGMGATSGVYLYSPDKAYFSLVGLASNDVGAALAAIESVWSKLAPQVPFQYRFVDELFNEQFESYQTIHSLILGITAFALSIAALGLFAMAAFVANRRQHEIGVRKTLGASVRQIVVLLLKDFSQPVLIANLIAWPLAYAAALTYLSLFVQRIELTLTPFALSLLFTLLVTWIAVGGQAWQSARLNPATVLRYE
jgi:putative ABC transport system permease protein